MLHSLHFMKKLIYHENTKVGKPEIFLGFFRAFVIDLLWFQLVRVRTLFEDFLIDFGNQPLLLDYQIYEKSECRFSNFGFSRQYSENGYIRDILSVR